MKTNLTRFVLFPQSKSSVFVSGQPLVSTCSITWRRSGNGRIAKVDSAEHCQQNIAGRTLPAEHCRRNNAGGTGDLAFDLGGNGLLDLDDVTAWRLEAGAVNNASGGAYRAGDANLAGSVDVSDFNIWNSNKFTLSDWVSDATLPGALNELQTRESKQNDSSTRIADAVFGDWNN